LNLRDAGRGLALTALVLYALNLRAPIAQLAPVVGDVSADLALTPATAGLLTGIPVLCFALATPFSAALVGRLGAALAATASLMGVLAGTLLRSTGGFATALVGTVVIGAAITIGNVVIPVVVARDFSSGVAGATGVTTAAMNAGAVATTIGMAPLAALVGWRWALASWGLVAAVALAVWWRAHGGEGRHDEPAAARHHAEGTGALLRRPLTWLLVVTFGLSSAGYYGLSAWLPSILHDEAAMTRAGAGAAASLFQGLGVAGALLAPLALARVHPRVVAAGITACWLTLPLGLLLAPGWWAVWASVGGIAQAGGWVVASAILVAAAGSPAAAGRLAAVVQTAGYALASTAPSLLGAVHTATGGWRAPLLVVLGTLAVQGVAHVAAAGVLARRGEGSNDAPAELAPA
jgi:CP family cyanate transporter-like MFS transporter